MTLSTESDNGLPLDMIIFGGMGDLAMRKLLPALYMAYLHGNLPALDPHPVHRPPGLRPRRLPGPHRSEHSRSFIARRQLQRQDLGRLPATARVRPPRRPGRARLRRPGAGLARRRPARVLPVDRALAVHHHLRQAGRRRPGRRATPAWCWKSRSAPTSHRRSRSTRTSAATSPNRRSTASTTTWARRPCRT